jgi:hypothetical protein
MRPLYIWDRRARRIELLKKIGGWFLCAFLFGGIGALLAWRG